MAHTAIKSCLTGSTGFTGFRQSCPFFSIAYLAGEMLMREIRNFHLFLKNFWEPGDPVIGTGAEILSTRHQIANNIEIPLL